MRKFRNVRWFGLLVEFETIVVLSLKQLYGVNCTYSTATYRREFDWAKLPFASTKTSILYVIGVPVYLRLYDM